MHKLNFVRQEYATVAKTNHILSDFIKSDVNRTRKTVSPVVSCNSYVRKRSPIMYLEMLHHSFHILYLNSSHLLTLAVVLKTMKETPESHHSNHIL